MPIARITCALALTVFVSAANATAQQTDIAEKLGFKKDAKLLIIHADDLALAHSVDQASFSALDQGAVSSASIMVPCPWLTEVAEYARSHPDADLGIHLTLSSEWKQYRWGSVASPERVASLFDPSGYLSPGDPASVKRIVAEEAEREVRAQVERARRLGIRPTHLDSHMGTLFATPELFAVYTKVAREYGLPFLALKSAPPGTDNSILKLLINSDVVPDAIFMAPSGVPANGWKQFYEGVLARVRPGLSELIVHVANDDAEMQAVSAGHPDYGSAWRQRDFDVMTGPDFKAALERNGITLVRWRDLAKLLPGAAKR